MAVLKLTSKGISAVNSKRKRSRTVNNIGAPSPEVASTLKNVLVKIVGAKFSDCGSCEKLLENLSACVVSHLNNGEKSNSCHDEEPLQEINCEVQQPETPHLSAFESKVSKKKFQNNRNLRQHLLIHKKKQFNCDICRMTFRRSEDFKRHKLIHSGEKPFACRICDKRFNRRSNATGHMRVHGGIKPFQCVFCSKSFQTSSNQTDHIRSHIKETPFECLKCDKTFTSSSNMRSHEKGKHKTRHRDFECVICNRSFYRKHDMTNHILAHTKEKPFECTTCKKSFQNTSHLNRHKRTHSGELFRCHICEKGFSQKSDVNRHMNIHTGTKSFQCLFCSKLFGQSYNLTKHIQSHIKETPFQCVVCNKDFASLSYMRKHVNAKHKDKSGHYNKRPKLTLHSQIPKSKSSLESDQVVQPFEEGHNQTIVLRNHASINETVQHVSSTEPTPTTFLNNTVQPPPSGVPASEHETQSSSRITAVNESVPVSETTDASFSSSSSSIRPQRICESSGPREDYEHPSDTETSMAVTSVDEPCSEDADKSLVSDTRTELRVSSVQESLLQSSLSSSTYELSCGTFSSIHQQPPDNVDFFDITSNETCQSGEVPSKSYENGYDTTNESTQTGPSVPLSPWSSDNHSVPDNILPSSFHLPHRRQIDTINRSLFVPETIADSFPSSMSSIGPHRISETRALSSTSTQFLLGNESPTSQPSLNCASDMESCVLSTHTMPTPPPFRRFPKRLIVTGNGSSLLAPETIDTFSSLSSSIGPQRISESFALSSSSEQCGNDFSTSLSHQDFIHQSESENMPPPFHRIPKRLIVTINNSSVLAPETVDSFSSSTSSIRPYRVSESGILTPTRMQSSLEYKLMHASGSSLPPQEFVHQSDSEKRLSAPNMPVPSPPPMHPLHKRQKVTRKSSLFLPETILDNFSSSSSSNGPHRVSESSELLCTSTQLLLGNESTTSQTDPNCASDMESCVLPFQNMPPPPPFHRLPQRMIVTRNNSSLLAPETVDTFSSLSSSIGPNRIPESCALSPTSEQISFGNDLSTSLPRQDYVDPSDSENMPPPFHRIPKRLIVTINNSSILAPETVDSFSSSSFSIGPHRVFETRFLTPSRMQSSLENKLMNASRSSLPPQEFVQQSDSEKRLSAPNMPVPSPAPLHLLHKRQKVTRKSSLFVPETILDSFSSSSSSSGPHRVSESCELLSTSTESSAETESCVLPAQNMQTPPPFSRLPKRLIVTRNGSSFLAPETIVNSVSSSSSIGPQRVSESRSLSPTSRQSSSGTEPSTPLPHQDYNYQSNSDNMPPPFHRIPKRLIVTINNSSMLAPETVDSFSSSSSSSVVPHRVSETRELLSTSMQLTLGNESTTSQTDPNCASDMESCVLPVPNMPTPPPFHRLPRRMIVTRTSSSLLAPETVDTFSSSSSSIGPNRISESCALSPSSEQSSFGKDLSTSLPRENYVDPSNSENMPPPFHLLPNRLILTRNGSSLLAPETIVNSFSSSSCSVGPYRISESLALSSSSEQSSFGNELSTSRLGLDCVDPSESENMPPPFHLLPNRMLVTVNGSSLFVPETIVNSFSTSFSDLQIIPDTPPNSGNEFSSVSNNCQFFQ